MFLATTREITEAKFASPQTNQLTHGNSVHNNDDSNHDTKERNKLIRMIINKDCRVKLGDFGLVCRADQQGEIEEGESRYCAREVINGNGPIDLQCADIFSLGASVYEIVLGRQLGAGGDHGSEEWHQIR